MNVSKLLDSRSMMESVGIVLKMVDFDVEFASEYGSMSRSTGV